jgi:hypothetical protein
MTEHQYKTIKFVLNADGDYDGKDKTTGMPRCKITEMQGEWIVDTTVENFLFLDELHDIVAFMEHLETTEDV